MYRGHDISALRIPDWLHREVFRLSSRWKAGREAAAAATAALNAGVDLPLDAVGYVTVSCITSGISIPKLPRSPGGLQTAETCAARSLRGGHSDPEP